MSSTDYDKIKNNIPKPVDSEEVEIIEKKKRLEKVVKSQPKKHKKGLIERLVIGMLGPDGIPAIGRRLNEDIVMPAIKNIIVDSITSGINMAIFGAEERKTDQRHYGGPASNHWSSPKTNYAPRTNYSAPAPAANTTATRRPHRGQYVPEYELGSRREAMDILDGLRDQIANYGNATIADYYDLLGIEPNHTDNDYGWDDLRYTKVITSRGGYVIQFPPVEVI